MKPMKIALGLGTCVAFALSALPAQARTDVGVSVQISQPGVYGRIDIGQYPQPMLVAPQPVWIARPVQVVAQPQPIYMWVPPGHQKNWGKHCARYGACGAPVYFVQDRWYHQHVNGPQQRDERYEGKHGGKHEGKHEGKGNGKGHRD